MTFVPDEELLTGRGTAALTAFLRASVPAGAKVLVPVNLCAITVFGIEKAGYLPVFYDVSADHGNAEPQHLERADTSGCAVLLAVHNFGRPVDVPAFRRFSDRHGMLLVEDACNALGASLSGEPVGAVGDAVFYSFNHGKIINCGYGGAVAVKDAALAARVKQVIRSMPARSERQIHSVAVLEADLRTARLAGSEGDQRKAYERYLPSLEARADAGLIGSLQVGLKLLPNNVGQRRRAAQLYQEFITHPALRHVRLSEGSVPWRYCILAPVVLRDGLIEALRARSIPCSTWYPPIDKMFQRYSVGRCYPGAESFAQTVINLWTEPGTSDDMIVAASDVLNGHAG
jgi:dTDP-4-amino-4,6-dideoxygalactose transaminase